MDCPRCRLTNPSTAEICDCGYPFVPGALAVAAPDTGLPLPQYRTWAIGIHLSAFLGLLIPLGSVLGPLVLWLLKRAESDYVDTQGRTALNFHLTIFLINLTVVGIGFLAVLSGGDAGTISGPVAGLGAAVTALGILSYALTIFAALQASNGRAYRYPLAIPFLKDPPRPR